MAWEAMQREQNWRGSMFLAGGCEHRIQDGNGSPQPIFRVARGIAHHLTASRLKIGTRELGSPAQCGLG
jgi:hypothetical protein